MEGIVVAIIAAIGGVLAALIQKGRKENKDDHNHVVNMIKVLHKDVSKVDQKISNHIDWHLDNKD